MSAPGPGAPGDAARRGAPRSGGGPPQGRVVLLVTTPRLPAGLLSAQAWDLVRTHPVLAGAETETTAALRAGGAAVTLVPAAPAPAAATAVLAAVAEHGTVVWLAGPDGDAELARQLGLRLAREPSLAELELVYGSWDPPGARVLDVVAVLDRLASPGGDPWLRERAEDPSGGHRALAHYLLEEAYEAYDALESRDPDAIREELGDVFFQVALHARIAEDSQPQWSIDELAGDLVEKLVRRNPHVFAGEQVSDVGEVMANWERIKRAEKARGSAVDGIALGQPALALAGKVLARAAQRRVPLRVPEPPPEMNDVLGDPAALGEALLAIVAAAQRAGIDAEGALRRAVMARVEAIRAGEPDPP